jgi:hypothetical protein
MSSTSNVPRVHPQTSTYVDSVASNADVAIRRNVAISLAVGATGVFIALAGVGVFLMRIKIAATFLGARLLFGMPVADGDAAKVAIVGLNGLAVVAVGAITIVGGVAAALITYARKR